MRKRYVAETDSPGAIIQGYGWGQELFRGHLFYPRWVREIYRSGVPPTGEGIENFIRMRKIMGKEKWPGTYRFQYFTSK